MKLTHKHGWIFSLMLLSNLNVSAQQLLEIKKYSIQEKSIWLIDGLQNLVVSNRESIIKYNPKGEIIFEQSQKSISKYDDIGIFNTLKMYGFSESQQMLCFFDNSLTMLGSCLNFIDYDLMNVSLVSQSGQSDKIWAFDQVNSSLHLITLNGLLQDQTIKNLKGVLNAESITQMNEWNNQLFLLDNEKGVYVFDIYGTLIRFVAVENVKQIQFFNDYLLCLKDKQLLFFSLIDGTQVASLNLDYENVSSFYTNQQFVYLQSEHQIIKTKFSSK